MNDYRNFFSLLGVILSIQTIWQLHKNWSRFWDVKVTSENRELASKVAIFILVPMGVFFHEIGHSLATWQVGGTVETFRWFGFYGYIVPSGDFSLAEFWWISFAGNLVSIVLAILPIPLIFSVRQRIVGEVLYRFVAIQSIYSLIYYPLWSAFNSSGDWNVIYSSKFQPYVSLLFILHLVLLWKLWKLYNSQQMLQWRLDRNLNTLASYQKLKLEQSNRPNDLQPQLNLVYFLRERNEVYEAKKIAKRIYQSHTNETSVKVLKVFIDSNNVSYDRVGYSATIKSARKLLYADLVLEDRVILYRLLCFSLYCTGNLAEALNYADQGLTIAPDNYMLLYHRANIYLLSQKFEKAIADSDLALKNVTNEDIREAILQLRQQCLSKIKL